MGTPPPRAAGGDPPESIDRCFRLCYVQVELDQAARSGFDRVRLGLPGQRAVFPAGLPILHGGLMSNPFVLSYRFLSSVLPPDSFPGSRVASSAYLILFGLEMAWPVRHRWSSPDHRTSLFHPQSLLSSSDSSSPQKPSGPDLGPYSSTPIAEPSDD